MSYRLSFPTCRRSSPPSSCSWHRPRPPDPFTGPFASHELHVAGHGACHVVAQLGRAHLARDLRQSLGVLPQDHRQGPGDGGILHQVLELLSRHLEATRLDRSSTPISPSPLVSYFVIRDCGFAPLPEPFRTQKSLQQRLETAPKRALQGRNGEPAAHVAQLLHRDGARIVVVEDGPGLVDHLALGF